MAPTRSATAAAVAIAVVAFLLDKFMFQRDQGIYESRWFNETGCVPVNFTRPAVFDGLNEAIDEAARFRLFERVLASADPLVLADKQLDSVVFRVLGTTLDAAVDIRHLHVCGLRTLVPMWVNATSPSSLQVGARSSGEIKIASKLEVTIAQRAKRWWQPCWTSVRHPWTCPPHHVNLEAGVILSKPSVTAEILLEMLQCDPAMIVSLFDVSCRDLTVLDLLFALLQGRPEQFLARVLSRVKRLELHDASFDVGRVRRLQMQIHGAGWWSQAILDHVSAFVAARLNRKTTVYRPIVAAVRHNVVVTTNRWIGESMSLWMRGSCFDDP